MNKGIKVIFVFLMVFIHSACRKNDIPVDAKLSGNGVFILNEGHFNKGNGSVSFYDYSTKEISHRIFYAVNGYNPGDVVQSIHVADDYGYIVVNNSSKVEVVQMDDFSVQATLTAFNFPRYMVSANGRGYISELGSSELVIVSLKDQSIKQRVDVKKSADRMLFSNGSLFIANWSSYYIQKPNNTILRFDTAANMVVDSLVVNKEPNSMVVDKNQKIWVLSSGGYLQEEYPALTRFDPVTVSKELVITFPDKSAYPTHLEINSEGTNLYFLNKGVYSMAIDETVIPVTPLIPQGQKNFYSLGVDPLTEELWVSDAGNYLSNGSVFRYSVSGELLDSFNAGVVPTMFWFHRE